MATDSIDIDGALPPFNQFKAIHRLALARGGRAAAEHARHHLYVARDTRSAARVLIKLSAKPGIVYQHDLANEIESLTTVNRELPTSRDFPFIVEHGRLRDGRLYLITSLFDEFPLATTISAERMADKVVAHLRTAIEVARAVADLHRVGIFHVDLNPMNILHRVERGRPVIRIVDFESSYEAARHAAGVFYNPPTTSGYSAPELSRCPPDPRADVFSLGAVLYTLLAGYDWSWKGEAGACVTADRQLDPDLREILLAAVAAEPDERYPSIATFQAALDGHLERIWPGRPR